MESLIKITGATVRVGLVLAAGLAMAGCVTSGLLEPRMVLYSNCLESATYNAANVHRLLDDDTLFVYSIDSDDLASPDYWMLKEYGLNGYLTVYPLRTDPQAVPQDAKFLFTGNVYQRLASVPEKVLGGGKNRLFYEVHVNNLRLLVPFFPLASPPFLQCHRSE